MAGGKGQRAVEVRKYGNGSGSRDSKIYGDEQHGTAQVQASRTIAEKKIIILGSAVVSWG